MDIQEATIYMAQLMKREADYFNRHLKGKIPYNNNESLKLAQKYQKYEIMRAQTREFSNELASMPALFNILESWKIVVKGKSALKFKDLPSTPNIDVEKLIEQNSNIAPEIKSFFRSKGYLVSDAGIGEDGWDIAVICTTKDSMELCSDIHKKYARALAMGIISVSRRFAGQHYLPGLYNYEDADRILDLYGE